MVSRGHVRLRQEGMTYQKTRTDIGVHLYLSTPSVYNFDWIRVTGLIRNHSSIQST